MTMMDDDDHDDDDNDNDLDIDIDMDIDVKMSTQGCSHRGLFCHQVCFCARAGMRHKIQSCIRLSLVNVVCDGASSSTPVKIRSSNSNRNRSSNSNRTSNRSNNNNRVRERGRERESGQEAVWYWNADPSLTTQGPALSSSSVSSRVTSLGHGSSGTVGANRDPR